MNPKDLVRLRHIYDAACEALSFARGRAREDLNTDRQLVLALVKEIEIIGEAASRLSSETRQQIPALPWTDIILMRNRLIHAYFDVDLDVVWKTLTDDLPPLIEELEKRLPRV